MAPSDANNTKDTNSTEETQETQEAKPSSYQPVDLEEIARAEAELDALTAADPVRASTRSSSDPVLPEQPPPCPQGAP